MSEQKQEALSADEIRALTYWKSKGQDLRDDTSLAEKSLSALDAARYITRANRAGRVFYAKRRLEALSQGVMSLLWATPGRRQVTLLTGVMFAAGLFDHTISARRKKIT